MTYLLDEMHSAAVAMLVLGGGDIIITLNLEAYREWEKIAFNMVYERSRGGPPTPCDIGGAWKRERYMGHVVYATQDGEAPRVAAYWRPRNV